MIPRRTGLGDVGADALGVAPGEEDVLGGLGIPGYGLPDMGAGGAGGMGMPGRIVTNTNSLPNLDDLMTANRDKLMTDPLGALVNLRNTRNQGGYAPTASGVKYIFTGGSPYKRTFFDKLSETALVLGSLRAQMAERKRAAERKKAENAAKAKTATGTK